MKLVYEGPADTLSLCIGDFVTYHRGVPFEARGEYADHLLHRLRPHTFSVAQEESGATEIPSPTKRVGRKPKE